MTDLEYSSKLSDAGSAHLLRILDGRDFGLVDPIDQDVLCRYVESFARWQNAEQQVSDTGNLVKGQTGFPSENPYIGIAARYSGLCSKLEPGVKVILSKLRPSVPVTDSPAPVGGAAVVDDLDAELARGLGAGGGR